MRSRVEIRRGWMACAGSGFVFIATMVGGSPQGLAQAWLSYAHDSQHSARSGVASVLPQAIRWQTPVDLAPQYSGGELFTHYGSPLITAANLVFVPVKTAAGGSFRVEARQGTNGTLFYSINSDYALPQHNWVPPWNPVLSAGHEELAMPAAGGTLMVRTSPGSGHGNLTRVAFFGIGNYQQNPTAFNNAIQICTGLTLDSSGNCYFGYISSGVALPGYPNGIPSGLAKVALGGSPGTFSGAQSLSGNGSMVKVSYNSIPAISADGSILYVAVNSVPLGNAGNFGSGFLCKIATVDLSRQASVFLSDPRNGVGAANLTDDSTASPAIGPDGDVYFGVLEGNFPSNNDRGWMLHFSGTLGTTKTPGAFGWDDTAAIVPASAVPSYTGTSSYLILTKYNNYIGIGTGNGHNRVAVLDPNATEVDPVTGATVMNEVLTVLGPSPDPRGGVREWCINTAAIDSNNKCAVINSEDGHVYRWSFVTNTLSSPFNMAAATGEAYTPTVIGPDGAVYAINNATLYCCQPASSTTTLGGRPSLLQPRSASPARRTTKARRP
jgi:hypothetical protein